MEGVLLTADCKDEALSDLEKINQLLDLCIDQDQYDILTKIVVLGEPASDTIRRFRAEQDEKERIELSVSTDNYPVRKVVVSDTLFGDGSILARNLEVDLLQNHSAWSNLFWAKVMRAEIRKKNKGSWSEYYDQLIYFLEAHIPEPSPESHRVLFNFLMELSAVAFKEASYGYAERAREIIKHIVPPQDKAHRDYFGTFYDRWVWYNKGLAYQHMGFHQRAVLEYNRVVSKFLRRINTKKDLRTKPEVVLELFFNVIPALYQRAEVSLQLQLGYHALQTVSEPLSGISIDDWLCSFTESKSILFQRVARNMLKNKSLLQLKALLQLMELDAAEKFCNENLEDDIYRSAEFRWNPKTSSLPAYDANAMLGQYSFQIKFVEETVTWFLEMAKELLTRIKSAKPARDEPLNDPISCLAKRIDAIAITYWTWVEGNFKDELVYFSRWARFLKVSANILEQVGRLEGEAFASLENEFGELLRATLDLYGRRRASIPTTRANRASGSKTLPLENFVSDDLPDYVDGLGVFYERISDALVRGTGARLKKGIEDYFIANRLGNPVSMFEADHSRLLAALDEYEKEFAENKKITALLRCNNRLIWSQQRHSATGCNNCLKCDFQSLPFIRKPVHRESFSGLLPCAGTPKGNSDEYLGHEDYERIMALAETHLTHHLKDHSVHNHAPYKNNPARTLHFVGLQRWNSETPAQGRSVGGGYFIYRTNDKGEIDFGIAIDPGFDFVRNLFRMGFSLKDVDIVLISHAHPDHIWDFESMVQLLQEAESKGNKMHRLNVILTLGSYQRLQHIIRNVKLRQFINPLVIDIRKELEERAFLKPFHFYRESNREEWAPVLPGIVDGKEPFVSIIPTIAYHNDYTEQSDSFGFIIEFAGIASLGDTEKNFSFGYTGDTKWVSDDLYNGGCPVKSKCDGGKQCHESIVSQYFDCDVLLVHLGSLIDHKSNEHVKRHFDYYAKAESCEKLIRDKNHPYLMGLVRLLRVLHESSQALTLGRKKLVLVGEFGEEMRGGIRKDIVERLRNGITPNWNVLPVDVGLDICLHVFDNAQKREFKFLCSICDGFHSLDIVRYSPFGQDEAIFYICETCDKSTPQDVRQDRLRQIYETGRELQMLPSGGTH